MPVHQVNDYREISLKRLREEIAKAGGVAQSDRDRRLAECYGHEGFELYQRLQRLFKVIGRGDAAVNVPTYNGGLFLSEPEEDDTSDEADAARFLLRARVDDVTLARALDRLARAEDEKRHELVWIDYRSLGVRQLGSIYEGLLEFRLRLAHEVMAVVRTTKGRKIERVVPLEEAQRSKSLTILRVGRGRDAAERILQPGEIYLENDRGERKLTGSYYTPDFVVEYLVKKTVGPIMKRKLEALRPELRKAQQWQRRMLAMAEQKGEPREKYMSGPAVDGAWSVLVEAFFDVKVLDPAMGSGHFLVEAVDFITERMLELLAGFPWNPIFAFLESTRNKILQEMDRHEIVIPRERLTDVNLLKRHVLKRCIYGVDLNPMAVELAKVSLWLDCFTLGAPLSFLDHHLRCGNSLLGVTIDEVQAAVNGSEMQMALFSSRFTALKLATAAMAAVGAMPDVTSEQIRESRQVYRSATNAMMQYRRLLDLWCSRWFVKPPAGLGSRGQGDRGRNTQVRDRQVQEYLRHQETEPYFAAVDEKRAAEILEGFETIDRRYLQAVAREARERRFFHWEIEFPEVFYRLRPGAERQAERGYGREFDAVVGNPPWVRQESLKALKPALAESFRESYASEADIYVYLVARSLEVLARGGRFGMILQNKWLKAEYAQKFRRLLRDQMQPLEVVDFGHTPELFPDADTFPCTLLVLKPEAESPIYDEIDYFNVERKDFPLADLGEYGARRRSSVPRPRLREVGWELLPEAVGDLMEKIRSSGVQLYKYVGSQPMYGIKTGLNEAFLIDNATRDRIITEDSDATSFIKPYLRGENIRRWDSAWDNEWMILLKSSHSFDWPWSAALTDHMAESIFSREFPGLYGWMKTYENALRSRSDQGRFWWELRACDYYPSFEDTKLIYQVIAYHSRFALDTDHHYSNDKTFIIPSSDLTLLAILNSSLFWWYAALSFPHMKDEAITMQAFKVEAFPIPQTDSPFSEIVCGASETLLKFAQRLHEYERQLAESVTEMVETHVSASKLEDIWKQDESILLGVVSRLRSRALTPTEKRAVGIAFREARAAMRTLRRKICQLEIELHHRVFDLYGLTAEDVALLRKTAPPRDPLAIAEAELRLLADD